MGNSFGTSLSLEKQYMNGVVQTKVDDCQVSPPPAHTHTEFIVTSGVKLLNSVMTAVIYNRLMLG